MPSVTARLFNRTASRFSRLFIRLRVNKDMGAGFGEYQGQQMVVIQLPPGQTGNALEIQDSTGGVPAQGNVLFAVNAGGNIVKGGATNVKSYTTQAGLTAAQLIAMGTTPVSILPAPPAGQAIVVERIVVELDLTATAFTGGGVVHFYYHGLTVEIMSASLAAATVQAGIGTYVFVLAAAETAGGSVVTPALGIDITNATEAFAAGTGTAVVTVVYSVITL